MIDVIAKQRVLDVLNSLEVIETNGGEDSYILVEMGPEARQKLNDVGVSDDVINQYGDDEAICILALAFNECYANELKGTKLVLRPNQYAVWDNQTDELNFFDTYQEALREYEGTKDCILEGSVSGDAEVYIFKVEKVASLVTDLEREEDPSEHGYESWMKWQDSENLEEENFCVEGGKTVDWAIRFIKDYDGYKAGDVLELPDEGLVIYYCGIRKVAERIS